MRRGLRPYLAALLLLFFSWHFAALSLFSFSRELLPERIHYATDRYVSPWFYIYLAAFAPEPPVTRWVFVYRLKHNGVWQAWRQPSKPLLARQRQNPFGPWVKELDVVEALAENMQKTVEMHGLKRGKTPERQKFPAFEAALRYVEQRHEADSAEVGVWNRHYSVVGDDVQFSDGFISYKYPLSPR